MAILQMIFLILCGSSFIATVFKKKIEETIIFDIMCSIILVYICGLFGHLALGVYAFIILSIGLLLTEIIIFIRSKDKKQIIKNILTPGLLIFFILNIILMYFERGRMFVEWDEFSHWGSAVKSMFMTNDFSTNPNSSLMFQSYPPAMTIFQYMFCFIKNQFIEYYAFYSYDIFCLSLLLTFTAKLEWKNILKIIFCVILIMLVPTFIYDNFYRSVYIDAALGLTFGFAVSIIITQKEKYSIYELILMSLTLMILTLQKDTGLFLAIIALVMFIIDFLKFKNNIKFEKQNLKEILKKCIVIIIPIMCVLLVKLSWNFSIKSNNASVAFSESYNIKGIISILLGKDDSYRTNVKENFINSCFEEKIFDNIISLNTIQLTIAFSILFIIISNICKFNKRENIFFTITIIGMIIYLFGLMITYMYKFNQTEALQVASFARYVKIYFTGMVFISTSIFIKCSEINNKTFCIFVLIFSILSPLYAIRQIHNTKIQSIVYRSAYIEEAEKILKNVNENEKLFFIDKQNPDYGRAYWIIRYSLIPTKFNTNEMFNITCNSEKSDSYLVYYPFEKIKETILKEYNYVYIRDIDDDFKNEFGSLFENITEQSLYKVENNKLIKIY